MLACWPLLCRFGSQAGYERQGSAWGRRSLERAQLEFYPGFLQEHIFSVLSFDTMNNAGTVAIGENQSAQGRRRD